MVQNRKVDFSEFTEEQKIQFQSMDDKTIRLFLNSKWTQWAYDYIVEVGGHEYIFTLKFVKDTYSFFKELIDIANETWREYKNTQIRAEMAKYEPNPLPHDFQLTVNTINMEAQEVAREEMRRYIHENLID